LRHPWPPPNRCFLMRPSRHRGFFHRFTLGLNLAECRPYPRFWAKVFTMITSNVFPCPSCGSLYDDITMPAGLAASFRRGRSEVANRFVATGTKHRSSPEGLFCHTSGYKDTFHVRRYVASLGHPASCRSGLGRPAQSTGGQMFVPSYPVEITTADGRASHSASEQSRYRFFQEHRFATRAGQSVALR